MYIYTTPKQPAVYALLPISCCPKTTSMGNCFDEPKPLTGSLCLQRGGCLYSKYNP